MGKFDGVLLVSDYDDTLFNSRYTITQRNKDAIDCFIAQGGYFTVASGRAYLTFAPQLEREGLRINAPAILFNGSMVYDFASDICLYETFLPERSPADVGQLLHTFPELGAVIYQDGGMYINHPNEVTLSYVERVTAAGFKIDERGLDEIPTPWRKVVLQYDNPLLKEAQRYMLTHWGYEYEAIFSNRYLLELTRKGSTKGGMVRWVANRLGVDPAHIYCVGDNQNDIPMLETAATGFAPANCSPEVKASGARIIGHCDDDCIAEIVEILDKMY